MTTDAPTRSRPLVAMLTAITPAPARDGDVAICDCNPAPIREGCHAEWDGLCTCPGTVDETTVPVAEVPIVAWQHEPSCSITARLMRDLAAATADDIVRWIRRDHPDAGR